MPKTKARDRQIRAAKAAKAAGLGESVLVVNSAYQPVNTTKAAKAVQLVLNHKAEVVAEGTASITSASQSFAVPSVIRLKRYVKVPDPQATWSPQALFQRDGYICQYCGTQLDPKAGRDSMLRATVDHIIPKHLFADKSRASTWTNTCTACSACNRRKGGIHPKSMHEAGMKFYDPNFTPKRPRGNFLLRTIESRPEWREWIRLD